MSDKSNQQDGAIAVEALRALGCREYEAKCLVALTRLPNATARDVAEITDIPRTRVYDAMDDLAEKGLVDIHHTSPKRYRSVAVEDAVEWFRDRYERELDRFAEGTRALDPIDPSSLQPSPSVWTLSEWQAILIRARNLVDECEQDLLVYFDGIDDFNETIVECIETFDPPSVTVATPSEAVRQFVETELDVPTYELRLPMTELETDVDVSGPATILLGDRNAMLVRSRRTDADDPTADEHAVFAEGASNSLITWFRLFLGY